MNQEPAPEFRREEMGPRGTGIPRARTTRYFQDHSLGWSQATGTPTFSPFFKRKGSTRCYGLHISQELKTHFTPIKSSVLGLERPQQLGVLCVLQETFPQPPCRASTAPLRSARKGSLTLCTKTSVLKVGPESTLKEIKCLVLKKKKKQKTCIWFPTHTSGSSQPPTIPAPEDPIPSPGIHEYFFHVEYTHKKILIKKLIVTSYSGKGLVNVVLDSCHNFKGHYHIMFAKKERCPQIPCKGLPWFPDGFLLYFYNRKEIKLYHKSKLNWKTSIGDLCHHCHWKPPQESQPGGCAEIFCYVGATSVAGYFTLGTFTDQIQTTSKLHLLLVVWLPITNASYINLMSSSPLCHPTEHQGHQGFAMVLL